MAHAGMLRASCESVGINLDIDVVVDPTRPCDVEHCRELIEFADALLGREFDRLTIARQALSALIGQKGVARAAAIVANFQMMNRALDTIGATFGDKLPSRVRALAESFGVSPPAHWSKE
ncbi:MAG: hypothetical protein WD002_12160 [Pseudomonadales bacterium]